MVAVARTRTIGPTLSPVATRTKLGNTDNPARALAHSKYMDDWVGNPHNDNPLYSEEVTANGMFSGDNNLSGMAKLSCTNYVSGRRIPSHAFIAVEGATTLATKAIANSNPGRAHVDIPLFIFELKDLPLLVKKRGNSILQTASSLNLNWQFGIKPMLSDFEAMLGFQDAFEKRMAEIRDLNDGLLKRTVRLGSHSATETESFPMESYLFSANSSAKTVTSKKVWATVKWKPSAAFANRPKTAGLNNQQDYIKNSLLGLTKASIPNLVWNALPWSWLVDWFTSAGDLIASSNNSVGYVAQPVNVMYHTMSTRSDDITGVPEWAGGDTTWTSTRETKERILVNAGLQVNVPFLNKRQLSILGSLAALKL